MRYVLTGHKGMMGGAFRKYAEEQGHVVDTLEGDLSVDETYKTSGGDSKFVFVHFAGYKGNELKQNFRNNYVSLVQILDKFDFEHCIGFIYISSIAAIGNPCGIITEKTSCNPISEYGYAKRSCELLVEHYLRDIPYYIIRPTNVYTSANDGFLGEIAEKILKQMPFEAWESSLNSKRDYILLDDVVNFILEISHTFSHLKVREGRIINLGSGYSYSLKEIISFYERTIGKKLKMNIKSNDDFASYDVVVDTVLLHNLFDYCFHDIKQDILKI